MGHSFEKKTVVQLKAILKKKGLALSGNKAALIERLKDYYAGSASSSSEEVVKVRRSARNARKVKRVVRDSSSSSSEIVPVKKRMKKSTMKEMSSESSSESSEVLVKRKREESKVSGGRIKLDEGFRIRGAVVHEDYGCMMNQTNIGNNNNKFYKMQLICAGGNYYTYVRYGRVGEAGKGLQKGPFSESVAIGNFKKQFKMKTGNEWDNRDAFVEKKGKYKIIEIDYDDDDLAEVTEALESMDAKRKVVKKKVKQCTLDEPTKNIIELIFDNDMFKTQMESFELDIKKLPLGKLSKKQVDLGFEILEEMEEALEEGGDMESLSNKFYTHVPHAFGRKRPPIIRDPESIQKKKDMLNVLSDIVVAQNLMNEKTKEAEEEDDITEIDHPLDVNLKALTCDMKHVPQDTEVYQQIADYLENTMGGFELELEDLFEIRRHGEEERFAEFDHIDHRKLLWHGTNVAVVVAILKGGLRIMPHSGGRVGKGIYFASENSKSACYVGCSGNTGIMFLSEVALGEQKIITRDDSSLKKAPTGYDSILAAGHTEPDPSQEATIEIDGKNVIIPQGKPIKMKEYAHSSFTQSEYLVYKESQNRLRYMLKLKFGKRRGFW